MTLLVAFHLRGVVMSNKDEGVFSGVITISGDLSLKERVAALEKQLDSVNQAVKYTQETSATAINELRLLVTPRAS